MQQRLYAVTGAALVAPLVLALLLLLPGNVSSFTSTVPAQQQHPSRFLRTPTTTTTTTTRVVAVVPSSSLPPLHRLPLLQEQKKQSPVVSSGPLYSSASSDAAAAAEVPGDDASTSTDDTSSSDTTDAETDDVGATVPQLIFNLVKGIVGAGVLSLPAGIAAFGGNAPSAVIPAIVLVATIGILSGYGFALIGRVCALTNTHSFRDAWSESVNEETSWIPAWSVTLKTLCATLAYSMILGDTFHSLLLTAGITSLGKTATLALVTSTILLPLCLLKNLSSLAPFSLLGSLGMVYTAVAMTVRYAGGDYSMRGLKPVGKFAADLAPSLRPSFGNIGASGVWNAKSSILISMLSTAYMAHFNAPKFYNELKDKTVPRFAKVVSSSFAISIALFATMASIGFLTFGANSSGLILNNYSTKDTLMSASRIAVAVSLLFSYPLAFVGARDGILDLLQTKNRTPKFLNGLTVAMLTGLTISALLIPDVSFVLAFAGATLGNALIYIFPALMFRGAVKRQPEASQTKTQKFEVKVALTSAAVGLGMGIMGAIKAVQSIM